MLVDINITSAGTFTAVPGNDSKTIEVYRILLNADAVVNVIVQEKSKDGIVTPHFTLYLLKSGNPFIFPDLENLSVHFAQWYTTEEAYIITGHGASLELVTNVTANVSGQLRVLQLPLFQSF